MEGHRKIDRLVDTARVLEGGGFPVRRPFPTGELSVFDPFLLIDELGPIDWEPGQAIGAPAHPHRGFETVTYLLEGRTAHRDSTGNSGDLSAGDVQWMTAGRGIVHEELPHPVFKREGGRMHGFQIWVNLPSSHKMMAPRYQEVPGCGLPTATSEDGLVSVKVIAGASMGVAAKIDTVTPIQLLHVMLDPGGRLEQEISQDHSALVYPFKGSLFVGGEHCREGQAALLGAGNRVLIEARKTRGEALVLSGQPLGEPVARYGPFVMNTEQELRQAFLDYQLGRMGQL
jgi:quercetin 2,3-dioxygenase